jgi:dTDP-L-rhamnose 4-epimerase
VTVLLTGGAGFVGRHLAHRLAETQRLVALDCLLPQVHDDPERSRTGFPGALVVRDVAEPASWDDPALADVAAVVHLAAETGTGQSMYEADRYRRVNVEGTRLAARFAVERDAALVLVSSRAVYGEGAYACDEHGATFGVRCCPEGRPVASTEDDPHHPVSVYGRTKSLAEEVARATCADRVPLTIIRPQNVIGPGQALHNPYTGVLAAFLAMLREGRPLTVYGDGHQTRDLVHVDDVTALVAHVLGAPPPPGAPLVLNSGTGERTSLLELAQLAQASAPTQPTGVTFVDVHRAGDIEHACADLTRLGEVGAPAPRRTTAEAVAEFVRASWALPVAPAARWDDALDELARRGLTS